MLIVTIGMAAWPVALPPAGADPAGGSVGLGPGGPGGQAWITTTVRPGTAWHGSVVVSNPSGSSLHVLLYPADGITSPDTGLAFTDEGASLRPVAAAHAEGSWLTLATRDLTLSPGRSARVPLTVAVPPGALPGDHVGGVVAEDARASRQSSHRVSITVVSRVAMAVVVVVPGPASPSIAIGPMSLRAAGADGLAAVLIPLTDEGRLFTSPRLDVLVRGPGGWTTTVRRSLQVVLPGDAINLVVPWPRTLGAGHYSVSATVGWPGGTASATSLIRLTRALPGTPRLKPGDRLVVRQVTEVPVVLEVGTGTAVAVVCGGLAWSIVRWRWKRRRRSSSTRSVAP